MITGVSVKSARALRALEAAGGSRLSNALRAGYAGAARVIRDKAKETTAFTDRSGTLRRSWRVSQNSRPFNHAKVVNTAYYSGSSSGIRSIPTSSPMPPGRQGRSRSRRCARPFSATCLR